jgi:hypothetical protein
MLCVFGLLLKDFCSQVVFTGKVFKDILESIFKSDCREFLSRRLLKKQPRT